MMGPVGRTAAASRWAAVLAAAAAWAMVVPALGRLVGLRLDVPARLEIADHVVPGLVVLAGALLLVTGRGGVRPGDGRWALAAGAATLAGTWVMATHVPLVAEARDGITAWGPALLHLSAGVPVLAAGLAMLLLPIVAGAAR
jgi:hypothetical protein